MGRLTGSTPRSSDADREALSRKLDALVQDVRAHPPVVPEEPYRPADVRTQYEQFMLPPTEGCPTPESLRVVLARGVDPRADPTVMAQRRREPNPQWPELPPIEAPHSGRRSGWAWAIAVAFGLVATTAFVAVFGLRSTVDHPVGSPGEAAEFGQAVALPPLPPVPVRAPPAATSAPPVEPPDPTTTLPEAAGTNPSTRAIPARPRRTERNPPTAPRTTPLGGSPEY